MKKLSELELPFRLLVSLFLIVLSCGFGMAHLLLRTYTEMADGEPGLGLKDITVHYHGSKEVNTFRRNVTGSMKKYFSKDEKPDSFTPEEKADYDAVLAWNDAGAKEAGFWDPELKEKDKNPKVVSNILYNRGCLDCHGEGGEKYKDAPLDTYKSVQKFLKPDTGVAFGRLVMLSHVHLIGMGMMFLLCGAAVAMTSWPSTLRSVLICGGLISILFDIGGWWATKYGGAPFAPLTMFGGLLMASSFGLSVAAVLYDIWIRKKPVA